MKFNGPTEQIRIGYAYPRSELGGSTGAFIVYCGDDCREIPIRFPVNSAASRLASPHPIASRLAEECAVEYALAIERPVEAAFIEIDFGPAERADRWRSRGVVHSLDGIKGVGT